MTRTSSVVAALWLTAGLAGGFAEDSRKVAGLEFHVVDLVFPMQDLGGKVQDLQVRETETAVVIELAADVLFEFDKADILPEAQAALQQVAALIRERAKGAARIEGHTDSKGSDDYNLNLSRLRAEAVRDWLVQRESLNEVRFTTHGLGETKPVAANTSPDGSDDPAGRRRNRRVEIILPKK